ncbi:MAG: glucose-1-phosphate adenylyltransferase [Chloroflexi bacterium]|nr:glucose-1-phosphate adenylyltransferase [Chloroflexota bacterium]
MRSASAMVLAGGRGKRMDILCHGRPKPVLPFAGIFRVIDFTLSNCLNSGIRHIGVLVDYQKRYLADYLEEWSRVNQAVKGLIPLAPKVGSYKGTADAVFQNLDYLQKYGAQDIVVLAGDHVYRMNYRNMLDHHERTGADVTIGVFSVPIEHAHRFGIVTPDAEGRIIDFTEKPRNPMSNLVSMGIYVFKREILVQHLAEDSADPSSVHDFGYSIIPKMVRQHKVFCYRFDGYWQDIGTVEAYYEANMELTHKMSSLGLNGKWPIFTKDAAWPLPKLDHQGVVTNSLISPGCTVKGEVINSVLSAGVKVEAQAVVRNSVIMGNTVIGKHSVVDGCVLDEDVNVGEFCYIGFGNTLLNDGCNITVLGKGVTVPNGTAIGKNCKILPAAGPNDFAADRVAPGSVILRRQPDPPAQPEKTEAKTAEPVLN